jgi:uncharacterized protein (TIRG00374 family)
VSNLCRRDAPQVLLAAGGELARGVADADGARRLVAPSPALNAKEAEHPHRRGALQVASVLAVVAVVVVEVLVLRPYLGGAASSLRHPDWVWLVVALYAETVSMIAFARLQRRMLAAGGVRVALRKAIAVTLAANAMSVTMPAGPAVSSSFTFRRMRSWGASGPVVTYGLVTSGLLSAVALSLIGIAGATVVGDPSNFAFGAAEVIAALMLALWLRRLARRPDLLLRVGSWGLRRANRLRRRSLDSGQDRIRELIEELVVVHPTPRDWTMGLALAALNWIADLVCLVASCRAIGAHGATVGVVLVAYAAGMAASSIPLLPGGIGVVDGALILALVNGGVSPARATAGVLIYRAISFGLVALVGWATWWAISRRGGSPPALAWSTDDEPAIPPITVLD